MRSKRFPIPVHGRRHPLSVILALSVRAMVSGARSLYAIAQWGRTQDPDALKELGFTRDRTPAVSTPHKVFSSMDTYAFESVLGEWIESRLGTGEEAIAVDGKALRGIHGDQIPGVRLVAAYTHELGLVVGQKGGRSAKRKSELNMAGKLPDRVVLTDRVVTGDALYCNRRLCERIVSEGGDYLMIVKGNDKSLYEDIELCFEEPLAGKCAYSETENLHGDRWERRGLWATDMLRTYLDWPGQRQVVKVESWRVVKGKQSRQVRYAITSLGPRTPAPRLLNLVRGHWGIEDRLRYVRDVTMGEDGSQVRTDSAPQMMGAVRNLVLNILRLRGERNIAAAIRKIGWKPNGALELLGLTT